MSSNGHCFDIGNTVYAWARSEFERTSNPFLGTTDVRAGGNGSLMRLAPVPLYFNGSIDERCGMPPTVRELRTAPSKPSTPAR